MNLKRGIDREGASVNATAPQLNKKREGAKEKIIYGEMGRGAGG